MRVTKRKGIPVNLCKQSLISCPALIRLLSSNVGLQDGEISTLNSKLPMSGSNIAVSVTSSYFIVSVIGIVLHMKNSNKTTFTEHKISKESAIFSRAEPFT